MRRLNWMPRCCEEVVTKTQHVVDGIHYLLKIDPADTIVPAAIRSDFAAILQLPICAARFPLPKSRKYAAALQYLQANLQPEARDADVWRGPRSSAGPVSVRWAARRTTQMPSARSRAWLDEWLLGRTVAQTLLALGIADWQAWQAVNSDQGADDASAVARGRCARQEARGAVAGDLAGR